MERERNATEERLNSTKRLDDLDEDESRLRRLNEEDQAFIDDANASIKKLRTNGWRLEMKSFRGSELRSRKEKLPCLSEKGSARSSKNMAWRWQSSFWPPESRSGLLWELSLTLWKQKANLLETVWKALALKLVQFFPVNWHDSQLPFQNCGAGDRLSRRAYLALDFSSDCFLFWEVHQKAALTRCYNN